MSPYAFRFHRRATCALLGILGITLATPTRAAVDIEWSTCPADITELAPELADRFQCSSIDVPKDHHQPTNGSMRIAVARIRAGIAEQRHGAIFANPGGPGLNPIPLIAQFGGLWNASAPASGETARHLRTLSDHYDLVAVVPRGVDSMGITTDASHICRSEQIVSTPVNITNFRDAAMLDRVDNLARAVAEGCQAQPSAQYINSEQMAYDMDAVRDAMGVEKIHYFGISYGTLLGTWYAALFPHRIDRLLLDSNMDWTEPSERTWIGQSQEAQRVLHESVAPRAAAAPDIYGLGNDPATIKHGFTTFDPRVQEALRVLQISHPAILMLGKYASEALTTDPGLDAERLQAAIAAHRFTDNEKLQAQLQRNAPLVVAQIFQAEAPPAPLQLNSLDSMLHTVACNDMPFNRSSRFWRDMGDRYARDFPAGGSRASMNPCAFWGATTALIPPVLEQMKRVPHVLMLQNEFDIATPTPGAMNAFGKIDGMHLVLAKGVIAHGLFGGNRSACADEHAARFLATGALPVENLVTCEPDKRPAARARRSLDGGDADTRARHQTAIADFYDELGRLRQ